MTTNKQTFRFQDMTSALVGRHEGAVVSANKIVLNFIRDMDGVNGRPAFDRRAVFAAEVDKAQAEFEASPEWQAYVAAEHRVNAQTATLAAAKKELAEAEQSLASGGADCRGRPDSCCLAECQRNAADQERALALLTPARDDARAKARWAFDEHNARLKSAIAASLKDRRDAIKAQIITKIEPLLCQLEVASKGIDAAAGPGSLLTMPAITPAAAEAEELEPAAA